MSLLYLAVESRTSHTCGLTRAEQRERIPSLCLLACVQNPRTPRSFLAKLLSSWAVPCMCLCRGCSSPGAALCTSHGYTSGDLHQPISPAHQVPYGWKFKHAWCISHSSHFCDLCRLAKFAFCPIIQVINEATEQDCT